MSKVYFFLKDIPTDHLAGNKREAYVPAGGYFDKAARRRFETKRDKRAWLKSHGMREAGIVNPDRAPD